MKTLKVGIMPREAFQKRTIDIAAGRYKAKRGEPKVWFSSMKSLAQLLNENNVQLLKIINSQKPQTMKELANMIGREQSNLNRTLKTLAHYGIVELVKNKHGRGIKPVAKAIEFDIRYSI